VHGDDALTRNMITGPGHRGRVLFDHNDGGVPPPAGRRSPGRRPSRLRSPHRKHSPTSSNQRRPVRSAPAGHPQQRPWRQARRYRRPPYVSSRQTQLYVEMLGQETLIGVMTGGDQRFTVLADADARCGRASGSASGWNRGACTSSTPRPSGPSAPSL
jgi:hypothetical protein